jgi:hypothetical protein
LHGTDCKLKLNQDCKVGKKVGLYHTHPESISNPSLADLENGYYYGINCIGGTDDNKIKCYARKSNYINIKDYNTITYHKKRFDPISAGKVHRITTKKGYEQIKSVIRDRDYAIENIKKNYFNEIDVL